MTTTTQLPDHVLARLRDGGVTAGWVGDQIGIGRRQAVNLLRSLGVYQSHGKWHLAPTCVKPKTYGSLRACVSSSFTASDFKDGGRE